jgi:pimeloyl-ACP methyl ester carboxylesterase
MKKIKYILLTKSIGLYLNLLSYVYPKKALELAYHFFSAPREGKLNPKQLPLILQEAKQETVYEKEHFFQSYTWSGNSAVILLIHGWESNAARWEPMIPYLKKLGSTIIAIDGPAHGLSSGKTFNIVKYATFIDAAVRKFKPQVLIGHSMGGKSCLYYQSVYQNKQLEKMVVLGAPSDFKILLQNYITLLGLNSKIVQLLEAKYQGLFRLDLALFTGQHFGSTIDLKGLIAHDMEDTVVAFTEGQKIASTWKNAVFITTKGLGHSMHDGELYEKITSFLFEAE